MYGELWTPKSPPICASHNLHLFISRIFLTFWTNSNNSVWHQFSRLMQSSLPKQASFPSGFTVIHTIKRSGPLDCIGQLMCVSISLNAVRLTLLGYGADLNEQWHVFSICSVSWKGARVCGPHYFAWGRGYGPLGVCIPRSFLPPICARTLLPFSECQL